MANERYTLFAQNGDREIIHASQMTSRISITRLSCIACHTSLKITCIQCQNSEAYYPVFEHPSGVLCLQDHGRSLLLYAKQLLSKTHHVKQPKYSQTLEPVLTMVPGYPNRYYELPAYIGTYPASVIYYETIDFLPSPDKQTLACLITTPEQTYGLVLDLGAGCINPFDVDDSGRIPIMVIALEFTIDNLLAYSQTQLNHYILHEASREWLTHPVHLEGMVKLRHSRYALSVERAAQQAQTLNKLASTDIIKIKNQDMTTEHAFCQQYHNELMGLIRYADVTKDIGLLHQHKQIISQSGIESMSHYEKVAAMFPAGLPLPYDNAHIIALYASQKVDMTLSGDNVYLDCYAIATWLVDILNIPDPLSTFISRTLFYCHDVNRWRDSHGLLGSNAQRQLFLPAKNLLIFIWKLSQYRPNTKISTLITHSQS